MPKEITNGSPVEIVLTLLNEITLAGDVKVCFRGRVQRAEFGDPSRVGVVAQIKRYEFLRGDEHVV